MIYGTMLYSDERGHVTLYEQWRERQGKPIGSTEPDESREADCIAQFLREQDQSMLAWLQSEEIPEPERVLYMDWNAPDHQIRLIRRGAQYGQRYIGQARHGLDLLRNAFEKYGVMAWQCDDPSGEGVITPNPEIPKALNLLDEAIQAHEGFDRQQKHEGNFRTLRSSWTLELWRYFSRNGSSMRAAARILAAAFELAGKESGDDRKRQESIYQTIRNAER